MRIPSHLAAAALAAASVAACAHAPASAGTTAAVGRCSGQPYVDVVNPFPERAYLQLVTASGRTFYVDEPIGPEESRRIETPRRERVIRAYVGTEPWNVERSRGRLVGNASKTTQVQVHAGCAATG